MSARPPLVGAGLWLTVVDAAGYRCECTGECGQPHRSRTARRDAPQVMRDTRCQHTTQFHQLHVVPREVVPLVQAVTLPAEALKAVCVDCHTRADRRSRQSNRPTPQAEALF